MRMLLTVVVGGALALVGCGPRSGGVVETAPGVFGLAVSGNSLPAATERGLEEATAHCAALGRQTQVLGTQMGRNEYQVAFRCAGRLVATAEPSVVAAPAPMALLQPDAAPVLNGEVFGRRAATPPPGAVRQALTPAAASLPPVAAAVPQAASLATPPGGFFVLPARISP